MNFALPEGIIEFRDSVREFAREHVAPSAEQRDRDHHWDPDIWRRMGEVGLLGLPFPEEYGGQGADCLTTTVATEAFAEGGGDGGLTLAWGAHTIIGSMPIVLCGTEEQKRRYVPRLATGECIAGLGLTEPASGSDAAGSMETRAVKKGDRYIINGSKMFITNGPIGDVFVVMAVTNKARGAMGVSAFIVEKNFKGFSAGKNLDKLGMRTSTTSELVFEDMEVPEENLLSKEDSGFARIGRATLEWERTVLVGSALGSMQSLLDQTVRYAKNRVQFGQPIMRFQATQDKIARARMYLDAARLLLYRSALKKDKGQPAPTESSIGKLFTSEALIQVAYDLGQVHGGYCFIHEYPIERAYRDARLGTIGGGTSEMMRSIIAANL
ncbi:MAG: acyl-CoA dehydrogenase family protein [Spirochaetales bacterium]|nr:acyl-CoA dehydrogenase family protein [Leptospiraceae bacterium]MCP5481214.1 acyl-CoA dehydrogenase family protein [Spirochaetales bacterium]